jgi:hypothetical protein
MKIKTLFAAAAIAGMSTTAIAQNVTTPAGEVVMIEKNQATLAFLGLSGAGAAAFVATFVVFVAGASGSIGGSN